MRLWRRVLTERRAVALPVVLFLAANVAVFALIVLPLRQSVARAGDEFVAAGVAIRTATELERAAQTATTRRDNADVELATFYSDVLPPNLGEAGRLIQFWLFRTAENAGVQFDANQNAFDEVRESQLIRVSSTAILRGPYQNILRFLYAVETAPEFVIVERVELQQSGVAQQNASGMLELAMDVATYYLPPPAGGPSGVGTGGND